MLGAILDKTDWQRLLMNGTGVQSRVFVMCSLDHCGIGQNKETPSEN